MELSMEHKRTIQQTAQETGLGIDTLRYYERIGLITGVERLNNGHRRYGDADITWILFLKQLRTTGMPIAQMQTFARLRREGDVTVSQRREMLEQHRLNLEEQVRLIMDFMAVIDAKIARHRQHEQTMIGDFLHDKQNG
jgi:DNA-binding transcriptional MerR regulator